jgi:rRNA maturation endonuclease Nob1
MSDIVVAMGVLNRAKEVSGISEEDGESLPYVCLACDSIFEVQHHRCPVCGSFDVRHSKWVQK